METKNNTNICKLNEMSAGQQGVIIKVEGSGEIHRRLLDMGAVRGAAIILRKIAPLGDPIEVMIRGFNLSLRKKEAEMIIIERSCLS